MQENRENLFLYYEVKKKMKEYPETHQQGTISIENRKLFGEFDSQVDKITTKDYQDILKELKW